MLWYCVVFCLSVGLLEIGVYFGLDKTITAMTDKELGIRMNGLDDFLQEHLSRLPLSRVLADLQTHVALQPHLTILQNARGHTIYCGTLVQELCGTRVPSGNLVSAGSRHLRIHTTVDTIQGERFTLLVATDLHFQRELLERFRNVVLLIVPATLLFATAGGFWLSKRAFSPVREIIAAVRSINERRLSLRLRVPATGDEIQLLSETLNGMLARVETSFRQVTELTANASHELRTPIAIIRTASEVALLSPRATAETHRKALVQILAEAEKNTRLLDSLLLLARSDAGAQPLNVIPVRLQESVAKAIEACRHLADAKSITLNFHVESNDTSALADPGQLHRLWLLLIDNAIKYTPFEGAVDVSLQQTSDSRPLCEIRDTGIGIPEADLPHIFHRFFRAGNARTQSEVGSGLGLTMVRWITDAHGAQLDVESAVGKGTNFRIIFPPPNQQLTKAIGSIPPNMVSA
ncbi:MAG: heavy metal sensor signal transduction histidine kinase [Edaphobacter sp.]|nr:heavy metal sensor signal transduction histidine kinase [Edaphobacter sp.]